MKTYLAILTATVLCLVAVVAMLQAEDTPPAAKGGDKPAEKTPAKAADEPAVDMAKVSYALGADTGTMLRARDVQLDLKAYNEGLTDALAGKKLKMTDEEMLKTMQTFTVEMAKLQRQKFQQSGVKNLAEGKAFLAKHGKLDGVKTTASGLQYKIVEAGDGKQPKGGDTVTVHYRGTLLDGKEFDSSHKRGQPATFSLGQVIPGWREAVLLMKEGATYKFVIPSELGYGPRGVPQAGIGPNAVLLFEVELIKVQQAGQ